MLIHYIFIPEFKGDIFTKFMIFIYLTKHILKILESFLYHVLLHFQAYKKQKMNREKRARNNRSQN